MADECGLKKKTLSAQCVTNVTVNIWILIRTDTKVVSGCRLQTVRNQMATFQNRLENLSKRHSGSHCPQPTSIPQRRSSQTSLTPAPPPEPPPTRSGQPRRWTKLWPANSVNHSHKDSTCVLQTTSGLQARELPGSLNKPNPSPSNHEKDPSVNLEEHSVEDWKDSDTW